MLECVVLWCGMRGERREEEGGGERTSGLTLAAVRGHPVGEAEALVVGGAQTVARASVGALGGGITDQAEGHDGDKGSLHDEEREEKRKGERETKVTSGEVRSGRFRPFYRNLRSFQNA